MALRKIGKYYGEDESLPDLVVDLVLPAEYENVTDLCMIMKLELELNWSHADCVTYANEYVAEVGIDNLKPYELPYLEVL
jgi:hypothetical protein